MFRWNAEKHGKLSTKTMLKRYILVACCMEYPNAGTSSASSAIDRLTLMPNLSRLKDEGYSGSTYQFPPGTQFPYHTHNCDKKDSIITGRFKFVSRDQGEV